MWSLVLLSALLLSLGILSACAGSDAATISVLVATANGQASVRRGQMITVSATVTPAKANPGVTWKLSSPNCPNSCGSLSSTTGSSVDYTAPAGEGADFMVTITATSVQDRSRSAAVSISITTPSPIELTVTNEPSTLVTVSNVSLIVVLVDNDSAGAGVDWTLSCGGGDCGTITPHTASGAIATYTAPATVPPSVVTIRGASTTDPTKAIEFSITIQPIVNPFNNLYGTYVFLLAGWDNSGAFSPAVLAGTFTSDGRGGITDGVIDRSLTTGVSLDKTFTGFYVIGDDGLGTMTINVTETGETLSIRFAVTPSNQARIISFGNTPDTGLQASGVIETQDEFDESSRSFTGDYAFGIEGVNLADGSRSAAVGRFTMDGSGAITSGTIDVDAPLSASGALTLTGGIPPTSIYNGTGTLTLSAPSLNPIHLKYFRVTDQETLVIDVDTTNRILYTGTIREQNRPAGGFKAASFGSTVIFELTGYDVSHSQSNTGVGFVTSDGNGNVTSAFLDQNADANFVSAGTTGNYTFDADGNGRAVLNLTGVQPNVLYFYDADSAFFLQGTTADVGEDVTFGIAEAQGSLSGPSPFNGKFAFSTAHPVTPFVSNFSGELTADGAAGTFTGTMDITFGQGGPPSQHDVPISGSFQSTSGQNGRFTVTLTPQGGDPVHLVLWFISPTRAVGVISDALTTNNAVIIFEQ